MAFNENTFNSELQRSAEAGLPKDDGRLTLVAFAGTLILVMSVWLAILAYGAWWLIGWLAH